MINVNALELSLLGGNLDQVYIQEKVLSVYVEATL